MKVTIEIETDDLDIIGRYQGKDKLREWTDFGWLHHGDVVFLISGETAKKLEEAMK